MNKRHKQIFRAPLLSVLFSSTSRGQEVWDYVLFMRIMVLVSKWKWQEPVILSKENTNTEWVSRNSYDLKKCRFTPRNCVLFQHSLNFVTKLCDTEKKKTEGAWALPKIFNSLAAGCVEFANSVPERFKRLFCSFNLKKENKKKEGQEVGLINKSFISTTSDILLKQSEGAPRSAGFVCSFLLWQSMSLCSAWGIVLLNPETLTWPECEMSPIQLSWKEHLWWSSALHLSSSPLWGCRRKHLSPLSSAQIRCLYLFRAEEINTEWSIVRQEERKRQTKRERWWGGSCFLFNCLFVSRC